MVGVRERAALYRQRIRHDNPDVAEPPPPSLYRELLEGTATGGDRLVLSLATGFTFCAFALAVALWVAAARNHRFPHDGDYLLAFAVAVGLYLVVLVVLWWPFATAALLWRAATYTLALWAIVGFVLLWLDTYNGWHEEQAMWATFLLGCGLTLVGWLSFARAQRVSWTSAADAPVRCVVCGYRLGGQREAGCPECGAVYTLDELFAKQRGLRRVDDD